MFEALLGKIIGVSAKCTERAEGAAFLKVARDLYGLSSLDYLGLIFPSRQERSATRIAATRTRA